MLIRFTESVVGRPYELGVNDCFSLIVEYVVFRGIEIPDNDVFCGHKVSEYAKDYAKDSKLMMGLAVDYIRELTHEIKPHKAMAGDILYVEQSYTAV